jgi:predicted DNA-binding ribbon-helix-helix protein
MTAKVLKHSTVINGKKTSISLEEPFWSALKEIAESSDQPLSKLIGTVDAKRVDANLSSALRVFVLQYYRQRNLSDR